MTPDTRPIVFFDGTCGWCCTWAGWLARRDQKQRLRFAPLGGETQRHLIPTLPPDTMAVVLWDGASPRSFTHGRAALLALAALGGAWRAFAVPARIPARLIDAPYRWLARNRHTLSKANGECGFSPEGGRFLP